MPAIDLFNHTNGYYEGKSVGDGVGFRKNGNQRYSAFVTTTTRDSHSCPMDCLIDNGSDDISNEDNNNWGGGGGVCDMTSDNSA